MNKFKQLLCIMLPLFGIIFKNYSMIYDNRYIPLYQKPFSRYIEDKNYLNGQFYFTTADEAQSHNDKILGIPELYGKYDQLKLANAIVELGYPDPLPQYARGAVDILWTLEGKLETQGFYLDYHRRLSKYIYLGFNLPVMHVNSRQKASLKDASYTQSQENELARDRRNMNEIIGIKAEQYSESGLGDLDFYIRVGRIWDYTLKCKKIDLGSRFGIVFPTGKTKDWDNPASIPFGGDGHFGFYFALDGEFELKEDWIVGFLLRLNKWAAKTKDRRMPINNELLTYGAITGLSKVDPGINFIFAPYATIEGIRAGLGVHARYTYVHKTKDSWYDLRSTNYIKSAQKDIKTTLYEAWKNSGWKSDYLTIGALYNFGFDKVEKSIAPIFYFDLDIPVKLFGAKGAVKSYKASFGLEFKF